MPKIKLIVDGGSMKPGPAVAQQVGPLGINMGQMISDVNEATAGFKGMKVPVEIDVDAKTKSYNIQVFSPPVAELLKKELSIPKGSGEPHKIKVGNLAIEQAISVAKTKMSDLLAKDLKAAVKMVVGTCVSLGILVENKPAAEVEQEIDEGKYDKEFSEEKTEVPADKKAALAAHFTKVKAEQAKLLKEEEAAAAAEEAEKAAEAAEGEAAEGEAAEGGEAPAEGEAAEGGEAPAEEKKE